ncbi:hypothetical protein [Alkaliphilus transvaalensis]|uniref:hypothetical protein n=1 Tax=Alkaliphilus transvaalensis TaxID=114628 RepID=UPI0004795CBA|nr:hypothetical protein [Alkaliphilus transvaalensis]
MNQKLKFILPALVVLAIMALAIFNFPAPFDNSKQRAIYDDNSKIVEAFDSYSFQRRLGGNTEEETNITFNFSGMETLWDITASQESTIQILFDAKISKGRFKVVLISPDMEVINILENTQNGAMELKLSEGASRIKIVGDNTRGDLHLSFANYEDVIIESRK